MLSSTFLSFNSTWWECPFAYQSPGGDFMFVVMLMAQFSATIFGTWALIIMAKDKKLLSAPAFICLWEGYIAAAFRIFNMCCAPLSTAGGRFKMVKWTWFLWSSTCEGVLATPSTMLMVGLWLKVLLKTMFKMSKIATWAWDITVAIAVIVMEVLLIQWAFILTFFMEKQNFLDPDTPGFMDADLFRVQGNSNDAANEPTIVATLALLGVFAFTSVVFMVQLAKMGAASD